MVVLKFGGKSLSSKKKIDNICKYIESRSKTQKLIVVVSAMGNTTKKLEESIKKYVNNYSNERETDVILSLGETYSSAIISSKLCSLGIRAISVQANQAKIYALGKHLNGVVTSINKQYIEDCLESFDVVVVAGFQAINKSGDIITLGIGGSDTTAVALGAAFDAEVEIYSDYDGIFFGDPKYLQYKKIKSINYQDIKDIAHAGAKVLSEDSAVLACNKKVNVCCKQSKNPGLLGTNITPLADASPYIVRKTDLELITINLENKIQFEKTQEYIIKNVNFYQINIQNYKIEILIDKKYALSIEEYLAKINNMLEE